MDSRNPTSQEHFLHSSTSFLSLHPNANILWPNSKRPSMTGIIKQEFQAKQADANCNNDDSDDRKHICPECDKSFHRKDKLTRHIQCVHEKIRPFRCDFCDSSFSRRDKLKRHVSSIHMKEKPYLCNWCPFQCSRRDRVRQHLRSEHSSKTEDDFKHVPGNSALDDKPSHFSEVGQMPIITNHYSLKNGDNNHRDIPVAEPGIKQKVIEK